MENRNPAARSARGRGIALSVAVALVAAAACWSPLLQSVASAQALYELPRIEGDYDIEELKRLIDAAQESGFTEEQIREITVEDEDGNAINAWEFLQEHERRRRAEAERIAAERARVYLTPHDVISELDANQPGDIDSLREKMLFVE